MTKQKQVSLQFSIINKVKVLFNSSQPVTTPELIETLYHEKVNVTKTYFNKYNDSFVLCNYADDLAVLFSPTCFSKLRTVVCKQGLLQLQARVSANGVLKDCVIKVYL